MNFSGESGSASVEFTDGLSISIEDVLKTHVQVVGPHLGKTIVGPWKVEGSTATHEGEGFKVRLDFSFDECLVCNASIVSDSDSLVGLLFPLKKSSLKVRSFSHVLTKNGRAEWDEANRLDADGMYQISDTDKIEAAFYPFPDPLQGRISLKDVEFELSCHSEESCFYFKGSEEPKVGFFTASDPWHPNLTASSLQLSIQSGVQAV